MSRNLPKWLIKQAILQVRLLLSQVLLRLIKKSNNNRMEEMESSNLIEIMLNRKMNNKENQRKQMDKIKISR